MTHESQSVQVSIFLPQFAWKRVFVPSLSCLIAMALKNSKTGSLPVSEIYSFMKEHFPYFKVQYSECYQIRLKLELACK